MRVPNIENAELPRAKFVDYLLSLTHPDGRGKAIFFRGYGFTPENWEVLAEAMWGHAQENDVVKTEQAHFGTRYVVEGIFRAADGRTPQVRSVWFVENDETIPRFATAYPLDAKPIEQKEQTS